jgi:hypothetical protein
MGKRTSFGRYYLDLARQAWKDTWPNSKTAMLNIAAAVVGVVLLEWFNINPQNQTWSRIVAGSIWALIIVATVTMYHAIRAPWKVHNTIQEDRASELSDVRNGRKIIVDKIESTNAVLDIKLRELDASLQRELESLDGCPQIYFMYDNTPFHEGFYVENRGADGLCLKIEPLNSTHYSVRFGDII